MNIIEEYQQGKRDFSNADLQYANLQDADLQYADLRGADLQDANLRGADLRGADLRGADLLGANLRGADLQDANLLYANLRGANLQDADLLYANLLGAHLRGANLQGARFLTSSHDIISEILCSRAENIHQRMLAGLVIVSRDWCWEEFAREISTAYPDLWEWSLSVLSAWECMRERTNAARILASRYRTDPIEAGKE